MKKYFEYIKEEYHDLDPYGEEDWDENDHKGESFYFIIYYPLRENDPDVRIPVYKKVYCHGKHGNYSQYYSFSLDNKRRIEDMLVSFKDFNLIENENDYTEDKPTYFIKVDNPYLWMWVMNKVFERYKEDGIYFENKNIEKIYKRIEIYKNMKLENFMENYAHRNKNIGF